MTPLLFVLVGLAAWRTWALVAHDTIADPIRDRIAPKDTKRRTFIECPYCCGFWIAGAWTISWAATHHPGWFDGIAWWWATAALVVIVEKLVGPAD